MSFTTVAFFVFLLAGIVVYYVLPKNVQWIWLLILSYIYYFTFSIKASLFMVFATVTIYFGGIWLQNIQNTGDRYLKNNKETLSREDKKAYKESLRRKKRWVLFLILLLDFGMLAVVKYSNFAIENINSVLGLIGKEPIGLLGMVQSVELSFQKALKSQRSFLSQSIHQVLRLRSVTMMRISHLSRVLRY